MTFTKIIEKIENRIAELESKKEDVDLKQIKEARRRELKEEYQQELDKLYLMKHYSK